MNKKLLILGFLTYLKCTAISSIDKEWLKYADPNNVSEKINFIIKNSVEHRTSVKDLEEYCLSTQLRHIDIKQETFNTLLANACRNNKTNLAEFALSKGANINTQINGFALPILEACIAFLKQRNSDKSLLEFLIKNGATTKDSDENNFFNKRAKEIIAQYMQQTSKDTYNAFINFVNQNKTAFEGLKINVVKNLTNTQKLVKGIGNMIFKRFGISE